MTGADRTWAARYEVGDVLHYHRGSKAIGIEKQSYATVVASQPEENLLTVQTEVGLRVTYNPARLSGISAYREIEREFANGDRLQFTAPYRELGVANRDLGTVESIGNDGRVSVLMDSGKTVDFEENHVRHFDHGYAVTSHSSQGLTAERVIINIDSLAHPDLIDARFAYVAVSRAAHDAQIFTDRSSDLSERLSRFVTKPSGIELMGKQTLNLDPGETSFGYR
jgi:hypothetical protein